MDDEAGYCDREIVGHSDWLSDDINDEAVS